MEELNNQTNQTNQSVSNQSQTPSPAPYIKTPPVKIGLSATTKIIIGIVIAVVVVGGGGFIAVLATRIFDPLWNPFRPEPEKVIENMCKEMKQLKTWHNKIDFSVAAADSYEKSAYNLSLKIEGNVDRTSSKNFKTDGKVDTTYSFTPGGSPLGEKIALGGEFKIINGDSYFKLTNFPALGEMFLGGITGDDSLNIKNQWVKTDQEIIKNLVEAIKKIDTRTMTESLIPDDPLKIYKEIFDKFKDILKSRKIYLVEKELPDEKIGENMAYHYRIALSQEECKKLIPEFSKVVEEAILNEIGMTFTLDEKEFQKRFDDFFQKIGGIQAEVWIGKKDNLLYKIKAEKEINFGLEAKLNGKLNIKLAMDFSDLNKPVVIEAPKEFKTLDEILAPLILLASQEAQDDIIKGDMDEIYWKAKSLDLNYHSYSKLSCQNTDIKPLCSEIKQIIGKDPIIRKSLKKYCVYTKLIVKKSGQTQYLCLDNLEGLKQTVIIDPGQKGYCDGRTFVCPGSSIGSPLNIYGF